MRPGLSALSGHFSSFCSGTGVARDSRRLFAELLGPVKVHLIRAWCPTGLL